MLILWVWAIFATNIGLSLACNELLFGADGFFDFQPLKNASITYTDADIEKMPAYRAPLIIPAIGRHTGTVIFAHGLGDTGHGWADVIKAIQAKGRLDEVKFILPHAPIVPISINGGAPSPGWFDLKSLAVGAGLIGPGMRGNSEEDDAGMLESRRYLYSLVSNEMERNGISSKRIVLGGFSQGGVMSLLTGLTSPVKLGGIIGLSCWLALRCDFHDLVPKEDPNKETPVFLGQGAEDPLVLPKWAVATKDILTRWGYNVDLKTYPGLQHAVTEAEIDDVEAYLVSRLPPKDEVQSAIDGQQAVLGIDGN